MAEDYVVVAVVADGAAELRAYNLDEANPAPLEVVSWCNLCGAAAVLAADVRDSRPHCLACGWRAGKKDEKKAP